MYLYQLNANAKRQPEMTDPHSTRYDARVFIITCFTSEHALIAYFVLSPNSEECLTMSVRHAGVAAQRAVTIEDGRPLDRHASGDSNVKFKNLFNRHFSTIWSHVLYSAYIV